MTKGTRIAAFLLAAVWVANVAIADDSEPAPAPRESAGEVTAEGPRYAVRDELELDHTSIIGNQELPKVLYIVPWKKSQLGELPGRPMNSLLNEVLSPVDRDVFRRRINYYEALNGTGFTESDPQAD